MNNSYLFINKYNTKCLELDYHSNRIFSHHISEYDTIVFEAIAIPSYVLLNEIEYLEISAKNKILWHIPIHILIANSEIKKTGKYNFISINPKIFGNTISADFLLKTCYELPNAKIKYGCRLVSTKEFNYKIYTKLVRYEDSRQSENIRYLPTQKDIFQYSTHNICGPNTYIKEKGIACGFYVRSSSEITYVDVFLGNTCIIYYPEVLIKAYHIKKKINLWDAEYVRAVKKMTNAHLFSDAMAIIQKYGATEEAIHYYYFPFGSLCGNIDDNIYFCFSNNLVTITLNTEDSRYSGEIYVKYKNKLNILIDNIST